MNTCVALILFVLGPICTISPVTLQETEYQLSTEDLPKERSEEACESLEKLQQNYDEEQLKRDSEWLDQYKAILIEGTEPRDLKGMVELFEDLYKSCPHNSLSPIVTRLGEYVLNLVRISHEFYYNCDNNGFEQFDKLLQKYAKGFSKSVTDYIRFHRSRFWQECKKAFLDCQRPDGGSYKGDETEAFSLAKFISCALDTNEEAKEQTSLLDLNLKSVVLTGVVNYINYKLEKKAHKKDKIKALFDAIIIPVCRSVRSRFVGNDKMGEIVKNREDLRTDLDEKSNNWLRAIEVCDVIIRERDSIERSAYSIKKWDYLRSFYLKCCF